MADITQDSQLHPHRRQPITAADGLPILCSEKVFLAKAAEGSQWYGVPLNVIATNEQNGLVVFLSDANPDYYEASPAHELTHTAPRQTASMLIDELGYFLDCPEKSSVSHDDLEGIARHVIGVANRALERAAASGEAS